MTWNAERREERNDELSAAARALHYEWHTPQLWSSIAAGVLAHERLAKTGHVWPETRSTRITSQQPITI